jgi:DNA polymerase elongation subunit (family B)
MLLYLDIETIPAQSPEVHARIAETVKPPANYKKADTIAAWEQGEKPALVKEAIAKTSFDGSVGHVCCIGWAWELDGVQIAWAETVAGERELLADVMRTLDRRLVDIPWQQPVIIGHNIANFDIRFLWQRAIVLGIPMPRWFPRDPKPWGNDVFDTMTAFAGSRGTIGMDRLCLALGMDGKGDIDGSMIADLWAKGEHQKIADYCKADVERTRKIHHRMMVAFGEAA